MRRFKRIAALLIAGFFAFAPPGTLIFGLLLVAGVVKNFWLRLALAALVVLAAAWFLLRRRHARKAKQCKQASAT